MRKHSYVLTRSKIWVEKGKRNESMELQTLEQIDDIWMPTRIAMTTKNGQKVLHKTLLRTRDVKFNPSLDLDDFSIRGLETGP